MDIMLTSGEKINLPAHYDLEERRQLVDELLNTYPEEFSYNQGDFFYKKYGTKFDTDYMAKKRLEKLATYIIQYKPYETRGDKLIMGEDKMRYRPKTEISFSQFYKEVADANGWH